MKNLSLTGILVLFVIYCSAQRPAQNPMAPKKYTPKSLGYRLFWEDQFNGNQLDPKKWAVRGVGPRALGFVSAQAVKVENGFLKLSAIKKGDTIFQKVKTPQSLAPRFISWSFSQNLGPISFRIMSTGPTVPINNQPTGCRATGKG